MSITVDYTKGLCHITCGLDIVFYIYYIPFAAKVLWNSSTISVVFY